jgi:methyl-accepting chemotaxis protein
MRLFLNLSVGMKLALSAILALLLLGGLGLRTQARMQQVIGLDAVQRSTGAADDALRDARTEAVRADTYSLAAANAQASAPAAQASAAAGRRLDTLQALARRAATLAPTPEARAAVEAALPLAQRYAEVQGQAIAARQRLLELRDSRFFPSLSVYDQRFEGVSSSLVFEVEGGARQQDLRDRLMAFHGAVGEMRTAIQRYLATEEADQARRVRRATAQLKVHGRGATAVPVSSRMREDMDLLLAAGDVIAMAAAELVAQTEAASVQRADDIVPAHDALEQALAAASAQMSQATAQGMDASKAALGDVRNELLVASAAIALLLLLSAWATTRAVGAPLRRLAPLLARIASGETAVSVPDRDRRDEIGRIAQAVEELRGRVAEAFAQSQMIAQMPVGVMRVDPKDDFRIAFMNPEMRRVLETVPQILPCAPEAVLGQSIDIFHRDPAHQRALLADGSRLPHRTRIRVAGEVMDLNVSAIWDGQGAYVGPMMVWTMVTEQAQLADSFEAEMGGAVGGVASQTATLQDAARRLAEAAATSGREATLVAEAAGRADADVQSVAAAAEQMAASITEITRRVGESAAVAGRAVQEAQATDETMRGLSESAARIGDVVRLIGDIAGQTNLLALNATIEAARAGEAGKGFAVVASEVKNLAGQTAKATEEIGQQIAGMQAATGRAVEAIRGIGSTVERTAEIATAIAAAVEQQGAATQEIARSAAQVAEATGTVSQRIGLVRQVAADTGEAAGGMLGAVETLAGQSGVLRDRSAAFLKAIRA